MVKFWSVLEKTSIRHCYLILYSQVSWSVPGDYGMQTLASWNQKSWAQPLICPWARRIGDSVSSWIPSRLKVPKKFKRGWDTSFLRSSLHNAPTSWNMGRSSCIEEKLFDHQLVEQAAQWGCAVSILEVFKTRLDKVLGRLSGLVYYSGCCKDVSGEDKLPRSDLLAARALDVHRGRR